MHMHHLWAGPPEAKEWQVVMSCLWSWEQKLDPTSAHPESSRQPRSALLIPWLAPREVETALAMPRPKHFTNPSDHLGSSYCISVNTLCGSRSPSSLAKQLVVSSCDSQQLNLSERSS